MKLLKWIVAIMVMVGGLSCQSTDEKQQNVMQKTRQQELGKFRELRYHRSGGATASRDVLTIKTDGQAVAESSMFGEGKKTLGEFRLLQLAQWFENLEKWNPAYPGKNADAMTEIRYGDSIIRVYESATDVPDDLAKLINQLRELVREVAGQ